MRVRSMEMEIFAETPGAMMRVDKAVVVFESDTLRLCAAAVHRRGDVVLRRRKSVDSKTAIEASGESRNE